MTITSDCVIHQPKTRIDTNAALNHCDRIPFTDWLASIYASGGMLGSKKEVTLAVEKENMATLLMSGSFLIFEKRLPEILEVTDKHQ
jgi:hypothetical protein